MEDEKIINTETQNLINFCKCNGMNLKHIKLDSQTVEICLTAVQQNGLALQFVKEQTEEICNNAVLNNPLAIQFVKNEFLNQSICKYAIKKNCSALYFIENHSSIRLNPDEEILCFGSHEFSEIERKIYFVQLKDSHRGTICLVSDGGYNLTKETFIHKMNEDIFYSIHSDFKEDVLLFLENY